MERQYMSTNMQGYLMKLKRNFNLQQFHLDNEPPNEDLIFTRNEKLNRIFSNDCDACVEMTSIMKCFMGIALSILCNVFHLCWPLNFPIGNSKYWYEAIIVVATSFVVIAPAFITAVCHFCVGIFGKTSLKTYVMTAALGLLCFGIWGVLSWATWVIILNYNYPIVFQGILLGTSGFLPMLLLTWYLFPKLWRQDKDIKRKLAFAISMLIQVVLFTYAYTGLNILFERVPKDTQWIMVFVIIVVRESNAIITSKMNGLITGSENDLGIEIIGTNFAAIRHIMFISVNLASTATSATTYLIMGIDFCINISFALMTLWYNRNDENEEKKINLILSLIINEAAECLMPISYIICLLMAYYGPNSLLLGNIRFGGWNFSEITDLGGNIFWISVLFLVDFGSTLLSFILLKIFGGMNIFKMYYQVVKEMGVVLAIQQAYIVVEYFVLLNVSFGMDMTFTFNWLTEGGNVTSIVDQL